MKFARLEDLKRSGFKPKVVIIGTGPAGISIAERLASRGVPSLLIEGGGYDGSAQSQDIYRGVVEGDHYPELHACRLRVFGGSSGCWSGWCRPLDAEDFLPRADVPASGWPIRRSDLDPFLAEASSFLRTTPLPEDRSVTGDLDRIGYAFSPPVRLGHDRRAFIEGSDRIGLLVDTAVVELVPVQGRIASVVLVEADGQRRTLPVELVCLCTGGIENSRILLWSNQQHQGGVVPKPETLGRYWMDHPVYPVGDAVLKTDPITTGTGRDFYAPSPAAKERLKIGGAHLYMRAVAKPSNRASALVREAMCVAPEFFGSVMDMMDRRLHCGFDLQLEWEQMPHAENRIVLDSEVDALGVPRSRLMWRKSEVERRTAMATVELYGEMLVREGLGRARIAEWLAEEAEYPLDAQVAGPHHMGGTRMADSPLRGVVDAHNKVFEVDNLYIGGSSVFTTGGHANPTLTIVQLSLRLADHLADRIKRG